MRYIIAGHIYVQTDVIIIGILMKKRSVVFVLIDGLADVSLLELDQKTPLEAAKTPAMDAIARTLVLFFTNDTLIRSLICIARSCL